MLFMSKSNDFRNGERGGSGPESLPHLGNEMKECGGFGGWGRSDCLIPGGSDQRSKYLPAPEHRKRRVQSGPPKKIEFFPPPLDGSDQRSK